MNKKINRIEVRQTAQKAAIRDEQNRRIQFAATHPTQETLGYLNTTLCGLEPGKVEENRSEYGSNKVTREKKKTLPQRLAGAFINPFTAILFCLALVSSFTDMIFPHFSLFGCVPKDFDCLTVVIILTMVFLSGTLRFVQESRSGNAAEKLLAMITTTCTVTRKGQEMAEIPLDEVVVGDIVHLSAGDMLPADVRILDAKDLFVSQASLTGASPLKRYRWSMRPGMQLRITLILRLWAAMSFPEVRQQSLLQSGIIHCLVPWPQKWRMKQWKQASAKESTRYRGC